MKTTRKLIPAIAMLLVSAVMLTTASYAWFTMGETATVNGMSVQAVAASSLVITKASVGAQTGFEATSDEVDFESVVTTLKPATSIKGTDGKVTASDTVTGLQTLKNTMEDVDIKTGLVKDTATDPYTPVAVGATSEFYVDYAVLLANGGGEAITGKNLIANITATLPSDSIVSNALTIMFLVSDDKDTPIAFNQETNMTAADENGKIEVNLGQIDIPHAFDATTGNINNYIKVTMRVYYDGALEDGAGKAYVRNNAINLSEAAPSFQVVFSCADAQ